MAVFPLYCRKSTLFSWSRSERVFFWKVAPILLDSSSAVMVHLVTTQARYLRLLNLRKSIGWLTRTSCRLSVSTYCLLVYIPRDLPQSGSPIFRTHLLSIQLARAPAELVLVVSCGA